MHEVTVHYPPHLEGAALAAGQALNALGCVDRVIMQCDPGESDIHTSGRPYAGEEGPVTVEFADIAGLAATVHATASGAVAAFHAVHGQGQEWEP